MTMIKTLTCAALAALLSVAAPIRAKAGDGSLETMCGNKSCIVDVKASGKVETAVGDIGIFTRHLPTVDYENQVGYFGLVDATYNLWGGIDAVAEAQFIPGLGLMPRAGVQYFGQWGDFSVYALATASLTDPYYGEAIAVPRFQTNLAEGLDLAASVECLTDFSDAGHDFSAQKIRAGVVIDQKTEVGAAVNLSETGSKGLDDPNYGGYLKVSF